MSTKQPINRIKAVLSEKKVTSIKLKDALGVSSQTVSGWCTNTHQPSLENLHKTAVFLDVDIRDLLEPTKLN